MRRLFLSLAIASLAIGPTWLMAGEKEDQDTANQVATKLRESGKAGVLKGYTIKTKVKDGTVWLTGSVRTQQQLGAALEVVQDVPGIDKIMNGLTIAGGGDAAVQQASGGPSAAPQAQTAVGMQMQYETPAPAAPQAQAPSSRSVVAASHSTNAPPLALAPAGPRMASRMQPGQPGPQGMGMAENVPNGSPIPAYAPTPNGGVAPAHFDRPNMPGYAWPSYASAPNYAAVTYPRQYSPTAWPFIGPFYPYPQVPLGWRKVSLEWHNGWWMLDFKD